MQYIKFIIAGCVLAVALCGCGRQVKLLTSETQTETQMMDDAGGEETVVSSAEAFATTTTEAETPEQEQSDDVAVYVCGAVRQPGVYYVAGSAIRETAVQMAGGFTDDADVTYVNLAQNVVAGEQIYIPTMEETNGISLSERDTDGTPVQDAPAGTNVETDGKLEQVQAEVNKVIKGKEAGVNIRFFEFEDEAEDFMIYDKTKEYKKAQGFLIDCINGTFDTSLRAIYPLKMMSDWSKKYPEYFKDDWASRFIYDHKFDFTRLNPHISEYQNIRMAADASACDTLVRRFTEEFPCGTVVHMACRLDNMFGRVDNGRIQWYSVDSHNIMSVRRAMYGVREREKTIGRRLMDFSWLDEIRCKQNQGVMFVCDDGFSYLNKNEVRDLIAKIRALFPGSHLVFTASSTLANATANTWKHSQTVQKRKKRRFSVNNAAQMFGAWRPDYRIIDEQPIFRYLEIPKKLGWVTKLMCRYNLIGYNHRIIHVKLGSEEYKINYKY